MSKKIKVVAIIQARMGSTRLPNKMLMTLGGKLPVIAHVINKVRQIPLVNEIWLATTIDSKDNELARWAVNEKLNIFRGSEEDVLDRYYQTAKKTKADVVVRITGDCPLLDPKISNKVIEKYLKDGVDYVANTKPPTYPDGMDTEVFSFQALERAWREAKLKSEREHVTPYIWKNPKIFKIKNVSNSKDLSNLRLTIDTKEDLVLLDRIVSSCEREGKGCNLAEVEEILAKNPEWESINSKYERDEGYAKSIKEDKSK